MILKEHNLLYISDMHDFTYGNRLYKKIKDLKPDIILIGGDIINKTDSDLNESIIAFLKKISDLSKIYFSNGNHEEYAKEYNEGLYNSLDKKLKENGICHISNESIEDSDLCITSLELPLSYYAKKKVKAFDKNEIDGLLKQNIVSNKYNILLCHNPRYMDDLKEYNPNLILSGHTHGGLVRIPLIGAVLNPEFELFPKYSGGMYHIKDDIIGIISCGLFTHGFHIRIFNMAELIMINLKPEDKD